MDTYNTYFINIYITRGILDSTAFFQIFTVPWKYSKDCHYKLYFYFVYMYCILSYFLMHMYTLNTICETYLKFVELIMKWSFLQQSMAVWNFWTRFDHLRCLSDCPCFTLQIWWPLVEYAALVFVSKALKALGTLVVVFERECLKVEWCAGRCSHKQAKKVICFVVLGT